MTRNITLAFAAGLLCVAFDVAADTQKTTSTTYGVTIDEGEPLDQPNGRKIRVGQRNHATVMVQGGIRAGETASQWCDFMSELNADGAPTSSAGYCTLVFDDGDLMWVSFTGNNQSGAWTVMGGTGDFAGATGNGTTTTASQRGDGLAWTAKHEGTITTR